MLTQAPVCHTERSEVFLFNAVLRSFTSVQDDKSTKIQIAGQLLYCCY